MYKSYFLIISLLCFSSCSNEDSKSSFLLDSENEKSISSLINDMTIEEKVGQTCQITLDAILKKDSSGVLLEPHQIDQKKLDQAILEYNIGSVLNVSNHTFSLETWHSIIDDIQTIALTTNHKIPIIYGVDAIHGATYIQNSTLFPQEIGLAATWDTSHARVMGAITAYETRASGIPWNFSPVLDIGRNPLWSRFWETFGEDPLLVTEMGEAIIKGYQGDNIGHPEKVAACMKHFLGYSSPNNGKDRTQAFIPEVTLREYYLPMFERAIEIGAATVMINSGEINGIPVHANPRILKDLLRDELGFTGLAVSDWEDIKYLTSRHRVAADYKEAIKIAINAGIDMSMVPVDLEFPVLLKELVEEGEVPMSRIDESVERILTLKIQLGLFEKSFLPKENFPKFASDEHVEASLKAAEESITLLKNKAVKK